MARSIAALLLLLVAVMVAVASAQYEEDSVGTVFFLTSDLHPGSKMTLHFSQPAAGAGAISLPSAVRADYDSVPFTSTKIPEILSRLSVAPGSPAAAAIQSTLTQCEAPPVPGVEALRCVTSYGSMVDFAATSLGTRDVRAARTRLAGRKKGDGGAPPRQAYEVESVRSVPVAGGDMVACHRLPYPYDVFACHTTTAAVYAVSLAGADNEGTADVEALAACHADAFPGISAQAYEKLGVKPGSAPVCHFMPQDSTLWMRN